MSNWQSYDVELSNGSTMETFAPNAGAAMVQAREALDFNDRPDVLVVDATPSITKD